MKTKKHFTYLGILFMAVLFLAACTGNNNNPQLNTSLSLQPHPPRPTHPIHVHLQI